MKTERPNERPELRFAEIYSSPEWQKLDLGDRTRLIWVAEGLRPGSRIGINSSVQKIIKKMGPEIQILNKNTIYNPNSPDAIETLELMGDPYIPSPECHRIAGKFLGYPKCCTEEYINLQKNLEARKKKSPFEFLSNVHFEMQEMIEATGTYPEQLDFCPETFTPCSATCPEALQVLGEWKEVLEAADPEAAIQLKRGNWQYAPSKKVHQAELDAIQKRETEGLQWRKRIKWCISILLRQPGCKKEPKRKG